MSLAVYNHELSPRIPPGAAAVWDESAGVVSLTNPTSTVVIGGTTMGGTEKLRVTGDAGESGVRIDDTVNSAAYLELRQGNAAAVSAAGAGRIRYNNTSNQLEYSENGSAYAAFGGAGGWTDDGATVRLTTATDVVAIGTAAATAGRKVTVLETGANQGIRIEANATTDIAIDTLVTAEAAARFSLNQGGTLLWGGGAVAGDARISRAGASRLVFDNGGVGGLALEPPANATGDIGIIATAGWNRLRIETILWGPGGSAANLTLSRLEAGYLQLDDPTATAGGFVPLTDDRGRLGTSRTPVGAVSRQWASVCATAIQWGAAGVAEDVSMTRPVAASTTWTTVAATSGTVTGWTWTPGNHTGQTASVEVRDVTLTAHTVTFATGAIATQRAVVFNAPTYAFAAASTITDAAVLYVSSAPIAGANATITNGYSLFCDAGVARFDGNTAAGRGEALVVGQSAITADRWVDVLQPSIATPGTAPIMLRMQAGAHTAMPAGTEANEVYFNLGQTRQFATGALTNQRAFRIDAPTYAFVAASTLTRAITLYVSGAPIAGANATITSSLSLWCDDSASSVAFFGTPSLGSGLGVMFVGNANTNPSANPTAGGILYSNAGAGTWRGSGGTVTAFGPAGPHCGECGYDSWRVAQVNTRWKSWHFECAHCGKFYRGGPKHVHDLLSDLQVSEKLRDDMSWTEACDAMGIEDLGEAA